VEKYFLPYGDVQLYAGGSLLKAENGVIHLLYVDDEEIIRIATREYFERKGGFIVDTASSAIEGLDKLTGQHYDAVISDFEMPGMDGLEFLSRVRSDFNEIPFIIFTGRGREEVAIRALNAGADFYLQKGGKPKAQFAELENSVRKAVERKRALEELKRSQTRLQTIWDNIPTGIVVIDGETHRIVSANPAALKVMDAPEDAVTGKEYHNFISPPVEGSFPVSDNKHGPDQLESTVTNIHGHEMPVLKTISAMEIDNRKYIVENFVDISERKKTERDLRELELKLMEENELYQNVVEKQNMFFSGPVVVFKWKKQPGWVVEYVSPNVTKVFGYTPDELQSGSTSYYDLIVKNDRERVVNEVATYNGMGVSRFQHEPYHIKRRDGAVITIEDYTTVLRDDKGNISHYLGYIIDVTERKQAEEALRKVNKKLNLLSSITRHDILNQITGAMGYIQLLRLDNFIEPGSKCEKYTNKIMGAIETIQQQILFTRDYKDMGEMPPMWFNVGAIVENVSGNGVFRGLKLVNKVKQLEIFTDPLFEKVIFNLFDNVIKHGEGARTIKFSALESEKGLDLICEDNGTGVPPDAKEKIFTREYFKNSGLGMFLSREILSITGLSIIETGVPGEGARFEIHVPRGAYRFVE